MEILLVFGSLGDIWVSPPLFQLAGSFRPLVELGERKRRCHDVCIVVLRVRSWKISRVSGKTNFWEDGSHFCPGS